jgi:3-hydroxy-3-methylglutaryl CoA synthase/uncharacterized OB-fold protein
MSNFGIKRVGGYLPATRLDRKAAAAALKWSGLGGPRTGRRSVAGWDEDALTLAVEAARAAAAGLDPTSVVFASTSAPFYERLQAGLVSEALSLPPSVRAQDVSGSRRCAVSALLQALQGHEPTLVTAGENRLCQAGNPLHLAFGDGGSAVVTGPDAQAVLRGHATLTMDFVDIYASRAHPAPYQAEERFIREQAVEEILVPAIKSACARAGISPAAIGFAAVAEPSAGSYKQAAARLSMTASNFATTLTDAAGDLGAAHPLFALALAFAQARPGDFVLLLGFGSGADALIFEVTGEIAGATETASALTSGRSSADYLRFLSLSGCVDLDWGVRAEFEQKVSATVLHRYGRDMLGFIGGRDATGNVQFPKTPISVNPAQPEPQKLADVPLRDEPAKIISVTADRLNYSPDPPFHFGLVQFANGARVLMEFTEAPPQGFTVGDDLSMRFRVKSIDRNRGFRTYFWKAAPKQRPQLES